MDYKAKISKHLSVEGLNSEEIYNLITPTTNIKMGDYSMPCFSLAKTMRIAPVKIAEKIVEEIKNTEWLTKIEAVNGYVNFYLNRELVSNEVLERILMNEENFTKISLGEGKTILLDFSSVNIAKQMHIGHLSTTAIGNSLNKIYKFLGYKTVALNYLGDYGTQFGDLIAAHKMWGTDKELETGGIDYVQAMYKRVRSEKADNEELKNLGREWFAKIENKDKEAINFFETFKTLTLNEVKPIFKLLNITFDEWKGEFYYSDKMQPVIDELKEKKLLKESQGAQVVDLEEDNLNVAIILKSDGSSIYTTRDLATAIDRFKTYNFEKCLYVTAYEQNLHFAQVFKILDKMGYKFAKDLIHVSYGRVSLPEGKLSSRDGAKALLKDIFDKAIEKSLATIENKNPNLKNKEAVAKAVGVGAVVYGALANQKIKDIVFDVEDAISFEGETAPYMQYTYARCSSVLKKYEKLFKHNNEHADYSSIGGDESFEIIKAINNFNRTVKEAGDKYEPSIISKMLMTVSRNFNKFYHEYKIVDGDASITKARVNLTKVTRLALKTGLNLLGIDVVEEM